MATSLTVRGAGSLMALLTHSPVAAWKEKQASAGYMRGTVPAG